MDYPHVSKPQKCPINFLFNWKIGSEVVSGWARADFLFQLSKHVPVRCHGHIRQEGQGLSRQDVFNDVGRWGKRASVVAATLGHILIVDVPMHFHGRHLQEKCQDAVLEDMKAQFRIQNILNRFIIFKLDILVHGQIYLQLKYLHGLRLLFKIYLYQVGQKIGFISLRN